VDAAVSAPPWRSGDRELAQAAVTCARLVARSQSVLVRVLGELDARDLPARSGASSTAAWTRQELNLTPREARTLASVATTGRKMPATGAALAAGELNLSRRPTRSRPRSASCPRTCPRPSAFRPRPS